MQPQYPIEPAVVELKPIITDIKFYDGRKLCSAERHIRDAWMHPSMVNGDIGMIIRSAEAMAWYRQAPVTVNIVHDNNWMETHVAEPKDFKEEVVVSFIRHPNSKLVRVSRIVTNDLKRIQNRIMDLMLQPGEFHVHLQLVGVKHQFYVTYYRNDAEWQLMGPRRTKDRVESDLLENFTQVMKAIAAEMNGAKGDCFKPDEGHYVFHVWNTSTHEANIPRVRKALESTGWNVINLASCSAATTIVVN